MIVSGDWGLLGSSGGIEPSYRREVTRKMKFRAYVVSTCTDRLGTFEANSASQSLKNWCPTRNRTRDLPLQAGGIDSYRLKVARRLLA